MTEATQRGEQDKAGCLMCRQGFFNELIPDHDAKVFNPPAQNKNLTDRVVNLLFGGFRRWDAVYFLHIAEHGYSYENTLAFFPLFPLLVRFIANTVFLPLQYCMSYANVLLIAAVSMNFVVFIISAVVLFDLSKLVLKNEMMACRAAQLYCVNPASIFFCAAYSESSFALLTWCGLLSVEQNKLTKASFFFALSGATRSNGLVNLGFVVHRALTNVIEFIVMREANPRGVILKVASDLLLTLGRVCVILIPFTAYQYYAYTLFCNPQASYRDLATEVRRYGSEHGYKMPYTGPSVWCSYAIPVSYAYVQSHHWDVGFLRYYKWKQLPNFVLASPMTCLVVYGAWLVISKYPGYCLQLGLKKVSEPSGELKKNDDARANSLADRCLPASCFVYIAHVGFLLIVGVLCMHVQVITRFIASSSPLVYWLVAVVTIPCDAELRDHETSHDDLRTEADKPPIRQSSSFGADIRNCNSSLLSRIAIIYFLLYLFVGTAAFTNFLPWT